MEISVIYVLLAAEALIVLLAICITLTVLLLRKPKAVAADTEPDIEDAESELDAIDLGNSYIDYLEQAMQRNAIKLNQQQNIENEDSPETSDNSEKEDQLENSSPAPDDKQSTLLQARELFLNMEKAAAETAEHEINFWENIYSGMQELLEQFKSIETVTETVSETNVIVDRKTESKEKVFYIETQGKKVDGEVNKLKDIIFEQENALSSMQKALKNVAEEHPEESEPLNQLKEQLAAMERQLTDSKMCMEVLEMENDRLQEEVDRMGERHSELFEENEDKDPATESVIDLDQIKEVVAQQEAKIEHLVSTIESLEIEASQAERLKDTLKDFTRTSQEMMSCITILEEENERLQEAAHHDGEDSTEHDSENTEDLDAMDSKISSLEEELIKKDVAYAQLQDEFNSMETEYLAMYEAMHGDN